MGDTLEESIAKNIGDRNAKNENFDVEVIIKNWFLLDNQSAFTCSKLTIEKLGQGVKYVQS